MIIGLTGYARSGKDEVAKILVEKYGYKRIAFADKIRELLYEMDPPIPMGYGLEAHTVGLQNYVDVYGWEGGKQNPTVRSMLQNLGVGARKVFNDSFWIHQAFGFGTIMRHENIVVTDVRFTNEADTIAGTLEGQIWRVTRPGITAVNNHISEHDLYNYKANETLDNEGTLEDLKIKVQKLMDTLNGN